MIGTTGATVLFIINVLFASVLGIAAGGFRCFVLHRPWGLRPALIDATLAPVVAVIAAYVVGAKETPFPNMMSEVIRGYFANYGRLRAARRGIMTENSSRSGSGRATATERRYGLGFSGE